MERDPKTGRFLPGNNAAAGNRGNRNSKWGNKNALKHGFFSAPQSAWVGSDGYLYIYISKTNVVKLSPEGFIRHEDGRISIRGDIAALLEKRGMILE